jgi:predicted O-methyltransferase YrrM
MFLNKFSQKNDLSKNKKRLVERVNEFRNWLCEQENISCEIVAIDDGLAIVKPIKKKIEL